MKVTQITRLFQFTYNGNTIDLEDINAQFTPGQVQEHYANLYPLLVNAKCVHKGLIGDNDVYEFQTTLGTKG